MDEEIAKKTLNSKEQINARIYDFPTSAILYHGKRLNYYKFIKSHEYEECDKAIERIKSKIDLQKINELIEEIPCISQCKKEFLKVIIEKRYIALIK